MYFSLKHPNLSSCRSINHCPLRHSGELSLPRNMPSFSTEPCQWCLWSWKMLWGSKYMYEFLTPESRCQYLTQTHTKKTLLLSSRRNTTAELRSEYPYSYQIVGRISEPLTVLRGNCSNLPSIVAIYSSNLRYTSISITPVQATLPTKWNDLMKVAISCTTTGETDLLCQDQEFHNSSPKIRIFFTSKIDHSLGKLKKITQKQQQIQAKPR